MLLEAVISTIDQNSLMKVVGYMEKLEVATSGSLGNLASLTTYIDTSYKCLSIKNNLFYKNAN